MMRLRPGLGRVLGAAVMIAAFPGDGKAQGDAIRRAREAVRDRTPSVASLFGDEPAITTSIEDAKDGVPSLDGFEPEWYSPLQEMPHGQDGSILLLPGTYVMVAESYCLHPGTFGPQVGDGYLHTTWKGPKADLVTSLIARSADHPEVPQRQVQLLLWAIVERADMSKLDPDTKEAAVRLLTPAELLDLEGYKLGTVPDALRDRVLRSVPAPARRLLEAENEMRRLLGTADASYADVERVAVLSGAIPASEATFLVPKGRWSYHPAGFFIRYAPFSYSTLRIDIYYPEKFEIRRDASGRIISIGTPDGRHLRAGLRHESARAGRMEGGNGWRRKKFSGALRTACAALFAARSQCGDLACRAAAAARAHGRLSAPQPARRYPAPHEGRCEGGTPGTGAGGLRRPVGDPGCDRVSVT